MEERSFCSESSWVFFLDPDRLCATRRSNTTTRKKIGGSSGSKKLAWEHRRTCQEQARLRTGCHLDPDSKLGASLQWTALPRCTFILFGCTWASAPNNRRRPSRIPGDTRVRQKEN